MVIRYSYHSKRYAFTMIELIFAIVIIAIAVLSLPIMSGVNQKAIEESIIQEAVFAASTELMGASAGYWDENSMEDIAVNKFSRVINIGHDCNNTTKRRLGHIAQPFHRRCLDNNNTTPYNTTGGSVIDLNDITTSSDLFSLSTGSTGSTTGASGYKQDYIPEIKVGINTSNPDVKEINATIKDSSNNVLVRLRMQSANIGEIDYYKRTF